MRYLLFFVCFFSLYISNAQEYIKFSYDEDECDCRPDSNNVKFDSISLNLNGIPKITNEATLACGYHCVGVHYTIKGKDWEAIKAYEAAIEKREKNKDKDLQKSYKNIGFCYRHLEYYSKSLYYLEKIDEVNKDSDTYRYIAENHLGLGEYAKALTAAEKSIQVAEFTYEKGDARNTYCMVLLETKDSLNLINAVKYADEAIRYFESVSDEIGIPLALNNKGNAYKWLNQYSDAIQAYERSLKIHTKNQDKLKVAETLNNIATALIGKGEYQRAIDTLDKSLQIKKKHHKNTQFQYGYAANYENFGVVYAYMRDYDKTLRYFQLVLDNLQDNSNPEAPYIYNKPDLLQVLDLKAQAALKAKKTDLAYNTYKDLDNWINEFYKDLSTNQSKLTWIARAHTMYTHSIEVALEKDDKEKAFQYAEKARAVLLWESHSQQAALNLLGDDKREEYDNLLAQIRQADHKYRDAAEEEKDELKRELDRSKQGFDQFEKTLSDSIPEYAQRKYQPKTITLNDVQTKILNNTTALVEYHWSADDMLYIFTLTKNDIYVDTIPIDGAFSRQIQEFYAAIKDVNLPDVVTPGYPIYQTAFEPIRAHLNKNIKKIILLPDGKLNEIPFEALPTKGTKELANISYLIDDYTFNYLYSCSSYGNLSVADTIRTALYIAPEFGKKDTLASLGETEIAEKLKELGLKLTKLTERQAIRDEVIKEMRDVDLIHFHSHAEQGKKGTGKIYLYAGDELSQNDIQEMSLKARHIVLSACETGTGKLNKGEGVLSLGWSFVYRGVPSVVMSLWKVNDESTSDLMENYYGYLDKEMPGDEALHEAKLDLIRNGKETHKHPYHWAAFIHTGNPPTQQFNPNTHKYLLIIGGFLLLSLLFYGLRRTKKHQK